MMICGKVDRRAGRPLLLKKLLTTQGESGREGRGRVCHQISFMSVKRLMALRSVTPMYCCLSGQGRYEPSK